MKIGVYKDLELVYSPLVKEDDAWMLIKPETWQVGAKSGAVFGLYFDDIIRLSGANVFEEIFAFLTEEQKIKHDQHKKEGK
jgi:hypothetical protein